MESADQKVKYLILGAGPTGLAAGYRLREMGEESFLILERDEIPGGLCRSYKTNEGFKFDTAGHIIFSKRPRFYEFLEKLGVPLIKHKRNVYIRLFERWIPYPLQNNVGYFPIEKAVDSLAEMATISARGEIDRSTFAKYMYSSMGAVVADNFLMPYNRKVWSTDPAMMSTTWMGDRVSAANFKAVLKAALENKADDGWGPNNYFHYPQTGGFGDIFDKMAEGLKDKIVYGQTVHDVAIDTKVVSTNENRRWEYDKLISTLPLDRLMGSLFQNGSPVREMANLAKDLRHNKIVGVGIGYNAKKFNEELEAKQPVCWLYFPDPAVPFYRITQLSNYSPNGAPNGSRSWLCELSFEADATQEQIDLKVAQVVPSLKAMNLLFDEDEILCVDTHVHEYGYPVPTLDTDFARKRALTELESVGIFSRGRFGNWMYAVGNTDHSVLQGFEIVERLLENRPEEVCHAFA